MIWHCMCNIEQLSENQYCYFCAVDNSPGIWLSLSSNGQIYPNNSVIRLSELYPETTDDSHSLICVTDKRPCCSSPNVIGEWYYPNRTAVPTLGAGYTFYTSRGDDGTVHLYARNGTMSPTNVSQFCCELPNTNNLIHTICVYLSE